MTRKSADPQGHARESTLPAPVEPENLLPAPEIPAVPEHFGEVARRVWHEVWTAGGADYVPATDRYVIERYAEFHERRSELQKVIDDEGWSVAGSQGQIVQHPAARILSDVEQKLVALEDRLGLNPEARLRLGISAIEKQSKLDKFLAGD